MSKPTILFTLPLLTYGGAERVASNLSQMLEPFCEIFWAVYEEASIFPRAGKVFDFQLPLKPHHSFLQKGWHFLEYTQKLRQLKKYLRPQVTVSFLASSNMANLLSGGERNILTIHQSWQKHASHSPFYYRFIYRALPRLYQRAERIVVVSKALRQELVDRYGFSPLSLEVIYNSLDIKKIRHLASQEVAPEHEELFRSPVVLSVGRLTKPKGQWHLIRAMGKVKKKVPEAKLVILGGKNPTRDNLAREIQELALSVPYRDDIHILGFQKNPFAYMAKAKVFCLSSLWEGFGLVLVEAMASGCPVVSTDCPVGPREILAPEAPLARTVSQIEEGSAGILTPPLDGKFRSASEKLTYEEELLAEALIGLLQDPCKRKFFANAGVKRSRDFDRGQVLHRWLEILGL